MNISFTWTAATMPDTVVLKDPTGVYGVRRASDGQIIVAPNTAMIDEGGGLYTYTFEDPDAPGHTSYEVWIDITIGQATYRIHQYLFSASVTDPTDETVISAALLIAEALRQKGALSNQVFLAANDPTSKPVWPSAIGTLLDSPDEFVALYDSGGVIDAIVGVASGYAAIEHSDVQIRIRAKRGEYTVAKKKARELKELLINTRNYEISVSAEIPNEPPELYRINVVSPLSKEAYIGPDDKGRPAFTVNVRVSVNRL